MFTRSARIYDAIYSFKDYARESDRLHHLIAARRRAAASIKPAAATRLLDVGCGTGGHIAHLKARYAVEGIDLDPGLLAVARARHPEVIFHLGDMLTFDLERAFDAVVCLFSSIGYVRTVPRLKEAVANLARHLAPGGVLVVEPWLMPGVFIQGGLHADFVDRPDLKIARMCVSAIEEGISILDLHYLVGTPGGIESFTERHELGLFPHEAYLEAFEAAGLTPEHDPAGLTGRGLYIATVPPG
jgi:SAM-dependent methyltransferase